VLLQSRYPALPLAQADENATNNVIDFERRSRAEFVKLYLRSLRAALDENNPSCRRGLMVAKFSKDKT
jgi:hypothetical protein